MRLSLWLSAVTGLVQAAPDSWRCDAYVWQREQSAFLKEAITTARERVSGYYPLAAEVTWSPAGAPVVTRVTPDYAAYAAAGRPVGPVLRIGPFRGPFAADDAVARALAGVARDLLAEARRAGVEPAELQVDFDCAERTLAGYRTWLEALRAAADGTPLVFTALPSWLRHRSEFAALAAAADGFVLQVHSLEKPAGGPDDVYSLVNYERALAWAAEASRAGGGRSFRVALPTYGYRLAFDEAGRFFALSADGPAPGWPRGTAVRTVRSDPVEMLRLERALAQRAIPGCTGVIWFRLPVEGDRMNWDMRTFLKVAAGEAPRALVATTVRWSEPRLAEIVVENLGDTSEPTPERVRLGWPAGAARLLAADGLGGYEISRRDARGAVELRDENRARESLLGPGKSRRIGWLRFSDATTLEIEPLSSESASSAP